MSPTIVDPTDPTLSNPGGKPHRQDSDITILKNLQIRVLALENALAQAQGVTFISPDGTITKTLSIDNSGNPVWT